MNKILVINPTTTEDWNEPDRRYFQKVLSEDSSCTVLSINEGPESIESFTDEAYAQPGILDLVGDNSGNFDAMVINCFADPGLDAARELTSCPVVGPAQSSMALATQLFPSYVVVSVLENSSPWVNMYAEKVGLDSNLAGVAGVDIPVKGLEEKRDRTVAAIKDRAEELLSRVGAEGVILGCTGMAHLAEEIDKQLPVPVIEPAAVAVKTAEIMAHLGLNHHQGKLYLSLD